MNVDGPIPDQSFEASSHSTSGIPERPNMVLSHLELREAPANLPDLELREEFERNAEAINALHHRNELIEQELDRRAGIPTTPE